jgi:hypothetical protein
MAEDTAMKTGNVIASAIALCWGLAVLIAHFVHSSSRGGSGAYSSGRSAGFAFAVLIGLAGARGLYREIRRGRAN